ncbi:CocE/NonD family hydrolase [uncultured Cohaesibacter sp.]|uniref:CocE/NonD family hydrolase n=1 Tax=uncultured Cohaesibacter sp. TaxID=1002546 RepID=UPI00292ED7EF|nr:CocE/NonD family hydrolase [uncultured Cohaesibacter sp.]
MSEISDASVALPDFLEEHRKNLSPKLTFADWQGSFASWREAAMALWRDALPPFETTAKGECLPTSERFGASHRLTFATGAQSEAILCLPEKGTPPYPAIILMHDHGGVFDIGWKKLFRRDEATALQQKFYDGQSPASHFLERGFAVFSMDALGWGSRFCGGYESQQALAANAMGLGYSLAGLVAAEDCEAARWLADHPRIDARRIGTFGFSFGGFRAWQLAALCPEVRALASLSWLACRKDLMVATAPLLRGQSAYYFLYPQLAGALDFPDMAGLGAGKPMLFRSGSGDRHMPLASVQTAWEKVSRICNAGGGPLPDHALHDKGHTCPSDCLVEAVDFLEHRLS